MKHMMLFLMLSGSVFASELSPLMTGVCEGASFSINQDRSGLISYKNEKCTFKVVSARFSVRGPSSNSILLYDLTKCGKTLESQGFIKVPRLSVKTNGHIKALVESQPLSCDISIPDVKKLSQFIRKF